MHTILSKPVKIDPKKLILDLLLAAGDRPLTVRDVILAGSLFEISENHLRVTLARLSAGGFVETSGRGAYRMGPTGTDVAADVATWRAVEARLRPWQEGCYVGVHSGALGRSDRVALRQNERALHLLGFRPLERGLHFRPDNIERDVAAVRQRLHKLGLDQEAIVFGANALGTPHEARIHRLWDEEELTLSYQALSAQLARWLTGADALALDVAARESFVLGGNAIHQLVFDPLLPEPFVDTAERHKFMEMVRHFDDRGRVIWNRFFAFYSPSSPLGDPA